MNDERFLKIARFYTGLLERHGSSAAACDWASEESQQLRFCVLSEVMPLDNCKLLDVGCGLGSFADFLAKTAEKVSYVGIDISQPMVDAARIGHPDLDIRKVNILQDPLDESFDVVTASGIFYLLGQDHALMHHLISRMYELAGSALAFNSLSSWANAQESGELYADPLETLTFCRTLTPWVVLRHDYHSGDFTIYMYRDRRP